MSKRPADNDETDALPSTSGEPSKRLKTENSNNNNDNNNDILEKESKFSKNSLDSDEEDEIDKYKVESYHLEGQEVPTIDRDGDIKITPFNMDEEKEIGVIDKEGTFIFHKEKEQVKDSWLDNIENVKVVDIPKPSTAHLFEGDKHQMPELDPLEHYKAMVELLQPGETVTKGLRRLGKTNNKLSSKERWKLKKEGGSVDSSKDQKNFEELTGLANDILISGNMDIYEYTYEKLKHLISNKEDKKAPLSATDDEALDMFAEAFDERLAAQNDAVRIEQNSKENQNKTNGGDGEEVKWEYKWENKEDVPVYGPHSNLEMLSWQEGGYFKEGIWVRRAGSKDSQFYSSKRIDFELYQ